MKCGECVLGVRQGAICINCEGTTFTLKQKKETIVEEIKNMAKKAVGKK